MTENRFLNIVVLGEMGVGKSALLVRFAEKKYDSKIKSTIIVDVLHAKIKINHRIWNLVLWDTCGQEKFRSLVGNYFRKADGVLLVYDVTDLASFTELPRWLSDLRKENETAPVIIVGNKIDQADSEKKVTVAQVREFAERNKLDFMESSAKSGENVDIIFERLTWKILFSLSESESANNVNGTVHSSGKTDLKRSPSRIALHEPPAMEIEAKKKKCC